MQTPSPQPGDVIFIFGKDKAAFWNAFYQRARLDRWHLERPWFSHTAVVIDDRFAYETSPHGFKTWSGTEMPVGARPVLIIDLLVNAKNFVILRSPKVPEGLSELFEAAAPLIAKRFQATYSLSSLVEQASENWPRIAKFLGPIIEKKTRTEPSNVSRMIQEDPVFWAELKEHLSPYFAEDFAEEYFCSQLIAASLLETKLLASDIDIEDIVPTKLYDLLVSKGWTEVQDSEYTDAVERWLTISPAAWRATYFTKLAEIKFWQNNTVEAATLNLLNKKVGDFSSYLGDLNDRLRRMSGS